MNFSEALEHIKKGHNGKGMFVYLVSGSEFTVNREPLNKIYEEGTIIKYRPHIDLKAADGTCGVWSISNNDALADDWEIL